MHAKPATAELPFLSIAHAARLLQAGEISSVELTRACLVNIDSRNSELNTFITVMADSALSDAATADRETGAGEIRSPLHGIPIAIKDLIDVAGVRTTAGSALFADRIAQRDASMVAELRAAGAVLIGKTNLHEFAYGGSSIVSHFGPVRNPLAPEYVAGGSSGGSAAALAAGMCLGAIGTDTAGSIRLPSAYCGVVGLKPTFDTWPTDGVIPLSWSYDHVGPMARSVGDVALMKASLFSPYGAVGARVSTAAENAMLAIARMRVGIARRFFWEDLDPEVERACANAVRMLQEMGASVQDCSVPVNNDRTVQSSESYTYHKRWAEESPEKYQPETLRRINAGAGYSASDYILASAELRALRAGASSLFEDVDVLLTPTVPIPPTKISELEAHPETLRPCELLMLRNTRPFNALGIPAISIPCGKTTTGLPIGVQIAGAPGRDEMELITVAAALEKALAGLSH